MDDGRTQSAAERCAYCGELTGAADWADRQWGVVEEPGPGGVPVARLVHASCYLHRLKSRTHPNQASLRTSR